jgi:hypothetical protein
MVFNSKDDDGMEYGTLVKDAFAYAKEGLAGNPVTWILLIVLTLLPAIPIVLVVMIMALSMGGITDYPLLIGSIAVALIVAVLLSAFYGGFMLKILRNEKPLPEISGYCTLFSDGIRYIVIEIIYSIPVIVVLLLTLVPALLTMMPQVATGNVTGMGAAIGTLVAGIVVSAILAFIIGLFAIVGVVRFARIGSIGEAFNFTMILATIRKIGWGRYIVALLIMIVLVLIVAMILTAISFVGIPFVGSILQIIISPFIGVFTMRYICLLYDSAGTA